MKPSLGISHTESGSSELRKSPRLLGMSNPGSGICPSALRRTRMRGMSNPERESSQFALRKSTRLLALRKSTRLLGNSAISTLKSPAKGKSAVSTRKSPAKGKSAISTRNSPVKAGNSAISILKSPAKGNSAISFLKSAAKGKSAISARKSPAKGMTSLTSTSIVGFKTDSCVMFGIDARLCLSDYSTVVSNQIQKIVTVDIGDISDVDEEGRILGLDVRKVYLAHSGDTCLQLTLKELLPEKFNRISPPSPSRVAEFVKEQMEIAVKKEPTCFGIVVIGIGDTEELEMFLVESYFKPPVQIPPVQIPPVQIPPLQMVTTSRKIDGGFIVSGSGSTWLREFLNLGNLPEEMGVQDARQRVMRALDYASHRDIGTGGLHQIVAITRENAEFIFHRFFEKQIDPNCSSMMYNALPPGIQPLLEEHR